MEVRKMKKMLLAMGLILFLYTSAFAECPAPFAKAKEFALSGPQNDNGNHMLSFSYEENGQDVILLLAYLCDEETIGVGSNHEGIAIVYEYHEKTGELTIWTSMGTFPVSEENRKEFFERVFQIFRIFVSKGLI